MSYAYYFLSSFFISILLLGGTRRLFSTPRLIRENYRGEPLPTGVGSIIVFALFVVEIGMMLLIRTGAIKENWIAGWHLGFLALVGGICLVGLLDDVVDMGTGSGFRGHLAALYRGMVTSGLLKAIVGFALALVAVDFFSQSIWELFLNAVLVALMINLLNLLDRRPGRAVKCFWLVYIAVAALNRGSDAPFLGQSGSILATSLVLFPGEMREKYMLGDAGSNVLGATVGYGLALGLGTWSKLAITLVVLALNLLSERYSFSNAVERSNILKFIDRLGGLNMRRVERHRGG